MVDATEDIANCTWAFATSGHAHPEIFAGPQIRSRCWIAGATGPACSRVKVSGVQVSLVLPCCAANPLSFNGPHPFIHGLFHPSAKPKGSAVLQCNACTSFSPSRLGVYFIATCCVVFFLVALHSVNDSAYKYSLQTSITRWLYWCGHFHLCAADLMSFLRRA